MGTPKALLRFRGETFLDRLIGALSEHCSPVLVVLGHQAETIRAGLSRAAAATFVLNENYRQGQLSSLQTGLAAVPAEAAGVLFTPVDYPAIRSGTVAELAGAFARVQPLLAIPRYQGRRGHPVCCSRQLIPEFLALPPDSQARVVIHRHLQEACYIDVEDPGIVEDIDDPEAYARLLQASAPR